MIPASKTILAICGSTREGSANVMIIHAIEKLAGQRWQLKLYDITDLPYFNQDVSDELAPASVHDLRKAITVADGVLICTPEYVFSLPGILKNALEWTVSTTVFSDKPTALITASSSGEKAHESLLLVMKTLGVKTNDDLCLLISGVKSQLNAEGKINQPQLQLRLERLVEAMGEII